MFTVCEGVFKVKVTLTGYISLLVVSSHTGNLQLQTAELTRVF